MCIESCTNLTFVTGSVNCATMDMEQYHRSFNGTTRSTWGLGIYQHRVFIDAYDSYGTLSSNFHYFSGLGLLEYLIFTEDMGMEPIMAVWAGYSLNGVSIAEANLAPFIQAAKDQVSSSVR